jgi:hypothetical protein
VLPVTAIMFAFSARSGALAARIGPRLQMTVGPLVVGSGLLLFARITASGTYLDQVLPAALVVGVGSRSPSHPSRRPRSPLRRPRTPEWPQR